MRQLKTSLSLIVCMLFAWYHVPAQRYPFYNLNVENGLIQSQARALAQDKFGHLWIGTLGGLSRYDGKSFTNYTVRDGMLDNEVKALATDGKGALWIGGPKGLSSFDNKGFHHYRFQSAETPAGNNISQISAAGNGKVWCISGAKVFGIIGNQTQELALPNYNAEANVILADGNTVWIAGNKGVLYSYKNGKWDSALFNGNKNLIITDLFKDSQHTLWVATNRGLYKLTGHEIAPASIRHFTLNNLPPILSLTEDKSGALWMGMPGGALRMTDSTLNYFNKKNGLCDNTITNTLTDKEGNVWLASDGQGVFRFSGAQFTILDESIGLPSAQVMSIEADRSNRLYLGTYDAGFYVFEQGKVHKLPLPIEAPPAITALKYRDGVLWLGTAGAGIWKYTGSSFQSYNKKEYLPSPFISCMYKDPFNRLWIGTLDGACVYDADSFHKLPFKGYAVQDFIAINHDSILLATASGIKLFHDDAVDKFITGKAPDSASLQCFARQGNSLWIGSSDNGLIYYNLATRQSFVLNKSNGMHSDFVYNVTIDNEGNIWAGTGYGIHKISIKEHSKPLISFYGKNNGIYGMESNHNAVLKMPDGSIWFGTTNGAVHYRPQSKLVVSAPSSIVIQSIKIFGEHISDSSYYDSTDIAYKVPYGLHLPYKKNNITFTFNAVTLSSSQVQYRYRMEGLDAPWSDWSPTNTVTFSALPPGKYTLQVQCTTSEDPKVRETKYSFEITTPFHKTTWFKFVIIGACILLGVTLQYIANRRKQNRIKLMEQLRREEQSKVRQRTAEDFHDELGNKLTRINVLTNVLKNKVGVDVPDADRIITQIQENTEQLYSGTRDILWSLKPSNDNLYEILHRIRDFGGELFQDTEIDFHFTGSDERWRNYRLPLDISRNLIMIFKEALNNCLKYAQATTVTLDATMKENGVLQMVLTDNGIGFDIHHVKRGHGIDNMNVRAKRINGKLYIDSRAGKGTITNLTFRIPEEYLQKSDK